MKTYFALAAITLLAQVGAAQDAVIPAEPLVPLDQWFHPDDYPPASMRGAEEGDVSALLTIDPQGMVTGCRVTHGSSHPLLDRATCTLAVRRGRFIPAKDVHRQPVADNYVISGVKWRINGIGAPSGGPPIMEVHPPELNSSADMPAWLMDDPTRARNRLTYHVGGILSAPLNVDIDLDSGRYAFESQEYARPDLRSSRSGILDKQALISLRRLAGATIASGMEKPECRESAAQRAMRPPQSDAILDFYVLMDGKEAYAPDRGNCWTTAADELRTTALAAVDPSSPATTGNAKAARPSALPEQFKPNFHQ